MNTTNQAAAPRRKRSALETILRKYLLVFAIATGGIVFALFHNIPALAPLKPAAYFVGDDMLPVFIFTMLYLSYCKVNLKDMKPHVWHLVLYTLMFLLALGFSLATRACTDPTAKILLEGALICFICPPAAAAGVVAGHIGGNESTVVTGVLIGNLLASAAIPGLFPLFTNSLGGGFIDEFLLLASRVFPVIVLPLILAFATKLFIKPLHRLITTRLRDASFYIWGVTLSVVAGRSFDVIVNSPEPSSVIWALAGIGLAATAFNFTAGKVVGQLCGQRISAGQAFGQRNGVFGLWISLSFLDPAAAIAQGCYILWQNCMNSWQIWHRERYVERCRRNGVEPYSE
jgi:BASS family bile acid:Na+ symporter